MGVAVAGPAPAVNVYRQFVRSIRPTAGLFSSGVDVFNGTVPVSNNDDRFEPPVSETLVSEKDACEPVASVPLPITFIAVIRAPLGNTSGTTPLQLTPGAALITPV